MVSWLGVMNKFLMMHWSGVMHGGMHLDLMVDRGGMVNNMLRHGVVQNGRIQTVVHYCGMFWRGQVMNGSLVLN